MSTILKALKRLDDERRAAASPRTLEEQVLGGGRALAPPRPWRRALPIAAGLTVFAAVGGGAWWQLGDRSKAAPGAPPPPPPAAAGPQVALAAPREPLPPVVGAPNAGTAVDTALRERMRAEVAREGAAPRGVAPRSRPTRGNEPEPEPQGASFGQPLAIAPPVQAARAPAEWPSSQGGARSFDFPGAAAAPAPSAAERSAAPPLAAARDVEAKPERPAQPESAAPPEPAPSEPAVAVVSPRPEIWVDRTQWHPSAEKRSALVRVGDAEARELHEGDALGGVVVKQIQPSGVLFLFEGEEFKRGIGGS